MPRETQPPMNSANKAKISACCWGLTPSGGAVSAPTAKAHGAKERSARARVNNNKVVGCISKRGAHRFCCQRYLQRCRSTRQLAPKPKQPHGPTTHETPKHPKPTTHKTPKHPKNPQDQPDPKPGSGRSQEREPRLRELPNMAQRLERPIPATSAGGTEQDQTATTT